MWWEEARGSTRVKLGPHGGTTNRSYWDRGKVPYGLLLVVLVIPSRRPDAKVIPILHVSPLSRSHAILAIYRKVPRPLYREIRN